MDSVPPAEVPPAADGERLDRFVAMVFDCSRAEASGLVRDGGVRVDGTERTKPSERLEAGQLVELERSPRAEPPVVLADETVRFEVLHEDDDIVVVDKPEGLVVHPGAGNPDGTLCNGLLARYPEMAEVGEPVRPGIVHRLDRATSGLMVAARNEAARESLVAQLASHGVERVYLAVVLGRPEADRGVIDAPIGRSRRNPLRMTVAEGAREARTHFSVLRHIGDPECTFVECRLETGRTHQIRVHMRSVGHPVLGDELYGGHREGTDPGRMFLHASELGLTHPTTDERVHFQSPLPPELAGWLESHPD